MRIEPQRGGTTRSRFRNLSRPVGALPFFPRQPRAALLRRLPWAGLFQAFGLSRPEPGFNHARWGRLNFYRTALGAEVTTLMRFKDSADPAMCKPETVDRVMHASFRIGETSLLASDGRCDEAMAFEGFSLSISVKTEAEADRFFSALADGGQVMMPLMKTFYSPRFGMATDRFGVLWMIIVAA